MPPHVHQLAGVPSECGKLLNDIRDVHHQHTDSGGASQKREVGAEASSGAFAPGRSVERDI